MSGKLVKKALKIVVSYWWCHPEYGGNRKEIYEYDLADFINAENKFRELDKDTSEYSHTTIEIVEKVTLIE